MSSLENQLFEWKEWDELDSSVLEFTGIKLVRPIGMFPAGTEFDYAVFDNLNAELVLGNNDENGHLAEEFRYDLYIEATPKK